MYSGMWNSGYWGRFIYADVGRLHACRTHTPGWMDMGLIQCGSLNHSFTRHYLDDHLSNRRSVTKETSEDGRLITDALRFNPHSPHFFFSGSTKVGGTYPLWRSNVFFSFANVPTLDSNEVSKLSSLSLPSASVLLCSIGRLEGLVHASVRCIRVSMSRWLFFLILKST